MELLIWILLACAFPVPARFAAGLVVVSAIMDAVR